MNIPFGEMKVFLIGDSPSDIIAGNNNGAFTIGVITGRHRESDFIAATASAIVNDLTKASGIYNILKDEPK